MWKLGQSHHDTPRMGFWEHSPKNFSCLVLHDTLPRQFLFSTCPVYNPYYKKLYYHCHLLAAWAIQSHIHNMAILYCSFMKIYRYQCLLLMDLAEILLPGKLCCTVMELSQSLIWQLWYHIRKIWLLKYCRKLLQHHDQSYFSLEIKTKVYMW